MVQINLTKLKNIISDFKYILSKLIYRSLRPTNNKYINIETAKVPIVVYKKIVLYKDEFIYVDLNKLFKNCLQ
jgi:hypothetical protein